MQLILLFVRRQIFIINIFKKQQYVNLFDVEEFYTYYAICHSQNIADITIKVTLNLCLKNKV